MKSAGKKGGRKIGRNADFCKAYKLAGKEEKNKALKLVKHIEKFPDDRCALHCFNNLPEPAKRDARERRAAHKSQGMISADNQPAD